MASTIQFLRIPSTIGLFQPSKHHPPTTAPAELYAGPAETPPPEATLRARAQDQTRRTALASSLLDADGPGAPTDAQRSSLLGSLTKVDASILEVAKNNNIRVGVVKPGEDMLQMGALKPRSFEEYQQRLPEMREVGDKAAAISADFDRRMQQAQTPSEPGAGIGTFNQSAAVKEELESLFREKHSAVAAALEGGKHGVMPFTPPQRDGAPTVQMGMQPPGPPVATKFMATMAGARTPEQLKEYETLMVGINGNRLSEARGENLQAFENYIGTLSADQQVAARKDLAQLKANPDQIRINQEKYQILAPDLYYTQDAKGESVRLNLHDFQTLINWGDANGKSRGSWDEKTNPQGSFVEGQYFRETKRVLIQSDALAHGPGADSGHGDVAIHELGHGLEDVVRTKDPAFYATWSQKLQEAHLAAAGPPFSLDKPPRSISQYALTNPAEYLAEGVANFYDDPKLLKIKDPALFGLTQEFLEHARTLK